MPRRLAVALVLLKYYRHKWQTASDVVLATGAVQPLLVQ
jgi:hypothetical protein